MSIVIDAHNHIGTRHGATQTGADLVAKMDSTGVAKAVIFPFTEGNFTNDAVKTAYDQFPERLIPYCAVNPWQPDAAAEVRRCVRDWGFKGLKLHPTLNGYHLADPGLVNPLFEEAGDLGIPIIVHGASDLYNAPPEFAEMARRFPKVKLLMAHMGFFWAVDQAIAYAKELPNLYLETSRAPIFEITTAVRELGPGKVIWGTDSPFVDYEWEFRKMERCSADKAVYDLVVGGTMAEILHIAG
ncbi:amidohydrolase family protein [Labrys monachus]|uniref:TIM-barrel fold metal-dependent hydrolase n=1 Tax=Labrys monachus TaxID=217067 RepID=A0ABU0FCZ5_9HYPH|nr:amidohydrolase family protein [Labrys monachus]MDQ0392487.1 putative TIM-barrel fold metal-dependent hydrolase [Labrys monachus]